MTTRSRERRARRMACLVVVALAVTTGATCRSVPGQDVPITPEERRIAEQQGEKLAATWTRRFEEAEGLIREGKGKKAVKITKLLAADMMDKILFGESAGQWLGTACLLQALGHAVEGDDPQAVWYWHVAQQLYPAIAGYDLAPYGEAGALLMANPLRPPSFEALSRTSDENGAEIAPPEEVFAPTAAYPRAQLDTREEPRVEVECRVDENGTLSHPLVIGEERRVPFVFAALDQLRSWRVMPATANGQPLAVLHRLSIQVRWRTAL